MIIDSTYFTGKINLPQAGNTEGSELVTDYIEQYETEYLQRILGYSLWKDFIAGISGSGIPDPKWQSLLTGAEYIWGGITKYWPGFEAKPTPIAQYVYWNFLDGEAESVTLVGTATADTDNSTRVNPVQKQVDAWNKMVDLNRLLAGFLNANSGDYPNWDRKYVTDIWWRYWYFGYRSCDCKDELYCYKNTLDL